MYFAEVETVSDTMEKDTTEIADRKTSEVKMKPQRAAKTNLFLQVSQRIPVSNSLGLDNEGHQ